MCRNIRTLFNFEPPATDDEVSASALQFVRKLSGFTKPSKVNAAAFELPNIAAAYCEPAEVRIEALVDTQDLALCWNVLDHCSDWKRVLINVADYLRQDGRLIMGTDCDVSDEIHASIPGGGPNIVAFCRRRGLQLDYELPGPALSRDWAGVFVKQ